MRKQHYRRFVMSRSKPSKKWDCTSASKNLPPSPAPASGPLGLSPHSHTSLSSTRLEPQTYVLLSGGRARQGGLFKGDPLPRKSSLGDTADLIDVLRISFSSDWNPHVH